MMILAFLAVMVIYLFLKSKGMNTELIHLSEEDQPIQIVSYNDSVVNYQKIIVQNPYEIIVNFTCDRETSKLLNYSVSVINHDDRIESSVDVDPYGIYVHDEANNFLYKHLLEIDVKKETINDLKLLKEYGFITEEEYKTGKELLKLGYVNYFVREKVGLIVEKLPPIN